MADPLRSDEMDILAFPGPVAETKPRVIFEAKVSPSPKHTTIIVECAGLTREQLDMIEVRLVRLAK